MIQQSQIKQLLLWIVLLIATIVLFELSQFDVWIEDFFYNFNTHQWAVNRNEPIEEFIFYSGIKKLLILFAVSILVVLVFFPKIQWVQSYRIGLIIVLLSAIFVPAVAGGLKEISNTPCPKNIRHYCGDYPDIKVFDTYPENFRQKCKIRCWPAGHASGGFALMSLFFLFKSPKNKRRSIIFALIIGFSMGIYKMLIGDHFLSHTIITMLLAWITILSISILMNKTIKVTT